jgi:hypothetical protein
MQEKKLVRPKKSQPGSKAMVQQKSYRRLVKTMER